jgi:hypothetical protein
VLVVPPPPPGSPGDFEALIYREFGRMKMALAAAGIEMN